LLTIPLLAQELPQASLETHFCGIPAGRFKPTLEILNSDLVLYLGLFHHHGHRGLAPPYFTDPIGFPEGSQGMSHRLVECVRGDLNGVLNAIQVVARDSACPHYHVLIQAYSLFIRHDATSQFSAGRFLAFHELAEIGSAIFIQDSRVRHRGRIVELANYRRLMS
jgi:hypothetical protein